MKTVLSFVLLGMALICHAQKAPKNEISIGQGAGFFFDTTRFLINSDWIAPDKTPYVTFTYTRLVRPRLSISAAYSGYNFAYINVDNNLKNNTVTGRSIYCFYGSIRYGFPIKKFLLGTNVGLTYVKGIRLDHYFYFPPDGLWREPVRGGILYRRIGITAGANAQHPIVWRFFGDISCRYQRVFSPGDRNQLYMTYSLGFKF